MTVVSVNGRTFDWHPNFDPQSRAYAVSRMAEPLLPRQPRFWTPGPLLDQGPDGACVGFGWSAEFGASPFRVVGITDTFAHAYYRKCKTRDQWPGEDYEGTSVLAGAKLAKEIGFIGEYRWALSADDVVDSVVTFGPVVEGTIWLGSMFNTHPSGLMEISGSGSNMGHCYLLRGYHPKMRLPGEGWLKRHEVFVVRQSWGPFGVRQSGDFYLPVEDWANRLFPGGEHCVPLARHKGDAARIPLAATALPKL